MLSDYYEIRVFNNYRLELMNSLMGQVFFINENYDIASLQFFIYHFTDGRGDCVRFRDPDVLVEAPLPIQSTPELDQGLLSPVFDILSLNYENPIEGQDFADL